MNNKKFSQRLLAWHKRHGRFDLPWQQNGDPYLVWLSEIMLQQTQVATVIPYFERFRTSFPDIRRLAEAPIDTVLHHWSGLGYYARARNLHRTAEILETKYGGQFPRSVEALTALPGIGESTAGAICAQAFGIRAPILDGNVKRVLARFHAVEGWPDQADVKRQLWALAETHTPTKQVARYTQAIMDLGATVCTRSHPACTSCPLKVDCLARLQDKIDCYPGKKVRRNLPVKATRMLVIREQSGAVLLRRRPPTGIWGGLWSLPEDDLANDPAETCERLTGRFPLQHRSGIEFRHTFSHFHLDILPVWLDIDKATDTVLESGDLLWYKPGEMQLGMAAPVSRLLNLERNRKA